MIFCDIYQNELDAFFPFDTGMPNLKRKIYNYHIKPSHSDVSDHSFDDNWAKSQKESCNFL